MFDIILPQKIPAKPSFLYHLHTTEFYIVFYSFVSGH